MATKEVETQGNGTALATKEVGTQGNGSILATKAVEIQGNGSILAMKAVEIQGNGSILATKAVEIQGDSSVLPAAAQPLACSCRDAEMHQMQQNGGEVAGDESVPLRGSNEHDSSSSSSSSVHSSWVAQCDATGNDHSARAEGSATVPGGSSGMLLETVAPPGLASASTSSGAAARADAGRRWPASAHAALVEHVVHVTRATVPGGSSGMLLEMVGATRVGEAHLHKCRALHPSASLADAFAPCASK